MTDSIKIVFTTDTLMTGGKERQLLTLFTSLDAERYEKYIVVLKGEISGEFQDSYQIPSQQIISLNAGKRHKEFLKYKAELNRIQPDVVYSWDIISSLYGLLVNKIIGFKFINGSIRHGKRLFTFTHLLRSAVCWFSPYIIANSYIGLKVNNCKPGKTRFVLYNGIDFTHFHPVDQKEKIRLRKALCICDDDNYLVSIMVGNLVPFKDHSTVIKAIAKSNKRNILHLIIGDGPNYSELSNEIKRLNLSDQVMLLGRKSNVREYLQCADFMIHSSKSEGISNAVLEGMACGLYVVATKVGGIPELLYPDTSAWFEYRNVKQLSTILKTCSQEKNTVDTKESGFKSHLDQFSASNMTARFENILIKILQS